MPLSFSALTDGDNIGVATTTLDSAGARVFASKRSLPSANFDLVTLGRRSKEFFTSFLHTPRAL